MTSPGVILVATVQALSPLTVKVKPSATVEAATAVGYTPTTVGEGVYVLRRQDTGAALIMAGGA